MKKVYVVTSGNYSDYGIDAIFTTKDLAEKFIASFVVDVYRDMQIEEWDLDPFEMHLKQNRKAYNVEISKDGKEVYVDNSEVCYDFRKAFSDVKIRYTYHQDRMILICYADDEKHAIKIASEKRAQILAANLWGVEF